MSLWIIAVLGVFFVQTLLAPLSQYVIANRGQLGTALGPRDAPPAMPVAGARFDRALRNMMEALPIFLTLALLAEFKGVGSGLVETGAIIFVGARILYVPAYVCGIPGLRSLAWTIGHGGLVAMLWGLWPTLTVGG